MRVANGTKGQTQCLVPLLTRPATQPPRQSVKAWIKKVSTVAIPALLEVCQDRIISWSELQSEGSRDLSYTSLLRMIQDGFPNERKDVATILLSFWSMRDRLSTGDRVALMDSRPHIPAAPSARFMESLRSGCDRYESRYNLDICQFCLTNALSQSREPMLLSPPALLAIGPCGGRLF